MSPPCPYHKTTITHNNRTAPRRPEDTADDLGKPDGIDVLLGADVLYSAIAWRALALTAKDLLSDDGVMIISTTGHR